MNTDKTTQAVTKTAHLKLKIANRNRIQCKDKAKRKKGSCL